MFSFYVASVWVSYIVPALLLLALLYKAAELIKSKWDVPKVSLPRLGWWVVEIMLGACFFFFLMRGVASYLSARALRADAASLSAQLISFADERQKQMPSPDPKDWDAYTRGLARVTADTRSEYAGRFAAQVALLRREFARRKLTDSALDSFYPNPQDPLAVRAVGERLSVLAEQLR